MPGRAHSTGIRLVVLAGALATANGLRMFDPLPEISAADTGLLVPTLILLLFVFGLALTVAGEPSTSSA